MSFCLIVTTITYFAALIFCAWFLADGKFTFKEVLNGFIQQVYHVKQPVL